MEGELVPLVLIPRFTSYLCGTAREFVSVQLDVAEFQNALVSLWRGPLLGSGEPGEPTFTAYMETSQDGTVWTVTPPLSSGHDPGANGTLALNVGFPHLKFLRIRIKLTGTGPAVTCWCTGFLQYRIED